MVEQQTVLSTVEIDWDAPWLFFVRDKGVVVEKLIRSGTSVSCALNTQPAPVRFVSQTELPSEVAYEKFIFDTGTVPTRDGLHDFFNGLCW
ncbi:MAG: DUF3025 domain-containing protein, partial [Hydrogenophaga sp.]|nr:DUF3025 domain-containing protein [Hydrogenophaga sp.]